MSDVELLAPAGNFETALAAFEAGADAVYCGLTDFSARAFADNFTLDDLKNLLRYARGNRTIEQPEQSNNRAKRVYVTFNTVIDEDNIENAVEQLARLDEARPDALIVQDIGVAHICREHFPGLELHASTQLVAHNLEGVLAMKELGFKRVVLARELSLEEIASIAKRCGDMELEVFVHGALCYSISGLCLFGAMEKGRSGNRGKCPYCCREGREVEEVEKRGGGGQRTSNLHCPPPPLFSTSLSYPFSMKDLRLGEDVRKLADAGVASLKIEGRMKSALYVASVTRYYRQILDQSSNRRIVESSNRAKVTVADLETVFSRRTTKLFFEGRPSAVGSYSDDSTIRRFDNSPIDSESLGHLGAEIGVVKRITKDREGLNWLRFHTTRGLEKHDGLQFEAMVDGKHVGMGIVEMRQAISRRPVFEVNAGVDVEVLLGNRRIVESSKRREGETGDGLDLAKVLKPGMKIYCSMSNAVKRLFPTPSFRPSDYVGGTEIDVEVTLKDRLICAVARSGETPLPQIEAQITCDLQPAKNPEKTFEGVKKAFSKLGETDYRLGRLTLNDPDKLFAPMSVLNDLRRDLVERLDEAREKARREKVEKACGEAEWNGRPARSEEVAQSGLNGQDARSTCQRVKIRADQVLPPGEWNGRPARSEEVAQSGLNGQDARSTCQRVKIRADQAVPNGAWDEIIVAINAESSASAIEQSNNLNNRTIRLSLPVYTAEPDFNALRNAVKRFLRAGYDKWEASDLATLRMLKALGVTDITADWTLYAFNSRALAELSALGVRRFVASPENNRENLQYLAESGYDAEFLTQQSTPLFVSLTRPQGGVRSGEDAASPLRIGDLAIFRRDGLWVTTKPVPRTFDVPDGVSTRLDLSWDLP